MKTIISILVLVLGTIGFLGKEKTVDHRTCSCAGISCSCTVTCLDQGEMPSCVCSTFSCNCVCNPKDATYGGHTHLPTMDINQEANTIKLEGYFRNSGGSSNLAIADGIKSLREAIRESDLEKYQANAILIESNFSALSESAKSTFNSWTERNFKK